MIAALFVQKNGVYYGLPDVDPWDEERNAMLYAGPNPVVAHPPCARWCMLAGLVQKRWGYKKGDDGGTFKFALAAVRKWGGVLEHPAYSAAFAAHGLTEPAGAWQRTIDGGWVCHVEQFHYGHEARKSTWLYAFGIKPDSMIWKRVPNGSDVAYVTDGGGKVKRGRALLSQCKNHTDPNDTRKRLDAKAASRSPIEFRDLLLSIARTCVP